MAIGFARIEIVKATVGSSAVGISAYISRSNRRSEMSERSYAFSQDRDDLAHCEVLLPEGAPEELFDGAALWNAAETADATKDRKSGEVRFKRDAQLARHMILALPWDDTITDEQRAELARRFSQTAFVDRGVAVELAIHQYDSEFDPADTDNADVRRKMAHIDNHGLEVIRINEGEPYPNTKGPHVLAIVGGSGKENWRVWQPHAHLLVSTRTLGPHGFGKKARNLNPGFINTRGGKGFVAEQDHWERQWADFQKAFFKEQGIDLNVDRFSVMPEKHRGKARSADSQTNAKNQAAKAEAHAAMRVPENVLAYLTVGKSIFTERDIDRALRQHGIEGAEKETIKAKVLENVEILRLYDLARGDESDYYTTRSVMAQESSLLKQARRIHTRARGVSERACAQALQGMMLDDEQEKAFRHCVEDNGLAMIQGGAGTGKSYTVSAIRRAYEADGRRVIGAAPTNTVAADMRSDGFAQADTLHALLYKLDNKHDRWNAKTVVIVDEAAMVGAGIYARLLARIEEAGAKLVLVGDDRQLASVSRGGIYSLLKRKFGAAQIDTVRRQNEDWQKRASRDFAEGRVYEGLKAYADKGHIQWVESIDDARSALVRRWAIDTLERPGANRFVYASTNREVDALNTSLRSTRVKAGQVAQGEPFETVRGKVNVAVGDRVQFHGNDKRIGIYNGTLASVTSIDGNYLSVRFDDGRITTFNAKKFDQFGLGYAGTVYRGQGKTQMEVLALYDSAFAWNARTAYVGMTRHKESVNLFVPRELAETGRELADRMRVDDDNTPALHFATSAEHARQLRIAQLRSRLAHEMERARVQATKVLAQEPQVRDKNAVWLAVFPKLGRLLEKRNATRRALKQAQRNYAQANWLERKWHGLAERLGVAQARLVRAERQLAEFVSHPACKRKVSTILRDERAAHTLWASKKEQHAHANRQFGELCDLREALDIADKAGWECRNAHDRSRLKSELAPYAKVAHDEKREHAPSEKPRPSSGGMLNTDSFDYEEEIRSTAYRMQS